MKPYTVAVIEDEAPSMELLISLLVKIDFVEIVFTARTVAEALTQTDISSIDILFCDVELPDGTCFDILDVTDPPIKAVCIVTGYNHYAIHAIKKGVVDYILKPLDIAELNQALKRIVNHLEQAASGDLVAANNILINDFRGCRVINEANILYLKSEDHYSQVFLIDGEKILTTYSLVHFEKKFSKLFLRIHKSYIANLKHIVQLDKGRGGNAQLSNGEFIPIAHRRKSELRKAMQYFS